MTLLYEWFLLLVQPGVPGVDGSMFCTGMEWFCSRSRGRPRKYRTLSDYVLFSVPEHGSGTGVYGGYFYDGSDGGGMDREIREPWFI